MSRTAKNQKDFKINSLSKWKEDCEFSILCSPYFQYPKKTSQINFEFIWNFGKYNSNKVLVANGKECFLNNFNKYLTDSINKDEKEFLNVLKNQKTKIEKRCNNEILYLKNEIALINNYSKKEAIRELIKSKKLEEKIKHISDFVKGLNYDR